jgi:pyruvate dehydrogenase E2 component (dihydrolipoyllysine-residue acetyltransferase)
VSTLRALTMPKWGIEMTEGTLAEWNIREGERVAKGQVIAQIETDKIVNEVQAESDVTFVRLLATPGEVYPVGALLGVTATEATPKAAIDEFVRAFRGPDGQPAKDQAAAVAHTPAASAAVTVSSAAAPAARVATLAAGIAISSGAHQLAQRLHLDVARITGTGRRGRITFQDVDQASKPARRVGGGSAISIAVQSAALDAHYASPQAKRLSLEHGVDLSTLHGTGPRGRINRADVAKAAGLGAELHPAAGAFEVLRMSATRKSIARQLTLSKSTIPHFYLRTQVNLDALLGLRADKKRSIGSAPSVNDYFIRATALALMQAPDINVQVHGEEIHRFRNADIAVAVATDKGLITPVIRAAQTKSVQAISEELREVIGRARSGKLRTGEIEGGSFTVSNLGMFGIDQFDAIINPPQGAILAVGAASPRPIERGGSLSVATTAQVSLSCDHRAIDGAVGARFLAALRDLLEAPQGL